MFVLCALTGVNVAAQKNPAKIVKTTDAALKAARQAAARIPAAPKMPAAPKAAITPAPHVSVTPAQPRIAKFVTDHQRTLVGLQKMVGVSTRSAWENLQQLGAVYTPKSPRPLLAQEHSFTAADLTELAVSREEALQAPAFPFQNQRQLIYRGMALDTDGKAIRNILENGLRTQDVGKEANTLILSIAGPHSWDPAIRKPLINLTDSSADAVMWAGKRLTQGQIMVVSVVKSNRTGSIITASENIPTSEIYAQTALLKINGKPIWCKLELDGENLRIIPYAVNPPAEQP